MEPQVMGEKIRTLRERKAWTQEHLAQAAQIAPRTVQRAEEGSVSAESLSAIAGALGVSIEKLRASKPPPAAWPRITPAIFYDDAAAAIAFLERAFGFEARLKVPGPDGNIVHSELELHDGLIMVAASGWSPRIKSPKSLEGIVTMGLHVFVDDVDEHHAHAKAAGATIVAEPSEAHGQRVYRALDLEGHQWSFATEVDEARD